MNPTLDTSPSYDELHQAVDVLVRSIPDDRRPTIIVGASRGGLVPAVIASHILGVPMIPVTYSSELGQGETKVSGEVLPVLFGERILIVDDIADSGYTLTELKAKYDTNNTVETLVMFLRDTSIHTPTYYGSLVTESDGWVVFPYEPTD